jgi:hypothetical protein
VTESVRLLGTFRSSTDIDVTDQPEFRGANGTLYREVDFEVGMSIVGTALEFAIWYKGKKFGCNSVEIEVEDV